MDRQAVMRVAFYITHEDVDGICARRDRELPARTGLTDCSTNGKTVRRDVPGRRRPQHAERHPVERGGERDPAIVLLVTDHPDRRPDEVVPILKHLIRVASVIELDKRGAPRLGAAAHDTALANTQ